MRRIIVSIAVSADGYIARRDGGVDWLDRPSPKGDYGLPAFFKSIDTILWGRTTYDESLGRGGLQVFGRAVRHVVFTSRLPAAPLPGVEFTNEHVGTFAARLRAEKGKDVWMMGGGKIIASFLDAGAIDEFILHVIPTFIGEGIPLLAPRHRTVPLLLKSCRAFNDGVVRLHYAVMRVDRMPRPARARAGTTRRTPARKRPRRSAA